MRRFLLAALLCLTALPAWAQPLTVAITTSTRDSGLFDKLAPAFTHATGLAIRTIAAGTGQVMRMGEAGDADVLLVHHRASEDAFMAAGYGLERRDVMVNDFVLIGPSGDPAAIRGETDAARALATIAEKQAVFLSRGDQSGTHKREQDLWAAATVSPTGAWYRETGQGQGATLNMAAGLGAYTLTDRGTWLGFKNKADLVIVSQGDPRLENPYGVIVVNPARHGHVLADAARHFADWLTGPAGQKLIGEHTIGGEPLFRPAFPLGGKTP